MEHLNYTVAVPNSKTSTTSAIYRNAGSPKGDWQPPVQTLYENFQLGVQRSGQKPCLGRRTLLADGKTAGPFEWLTYQQVQQKFTLFGSGLLHLRAEAKLPETHWHLGLFSVNRPEWVIAEQAANAYSIVTVALYDTLGADTLQYVINHAELPIVVCSHDKIATLLKNAHMCPGLKMIISMDPLKDDKLTGILRDWAADRGLALLSFAEVEKLGERFPRAHIPPKPTDLATICYTSGTTGMPKGAMLVHLNFTACGHSVGFHKLNLSNDDVMISYLPLAHCFERVLHVAMYSVGASIGFYRGDVLVLLEDIAALKPTFFPSVPRLFNRIYAKLVDGTTKAPGLRGILFRRAVATKIANLKAGLGNKHAFWDRLLFSKVAAVLGGRVRLMITGSAPISADVLTFLRICFCCDILEGYGQTENSAGATLTFPEDHIAGQVGAPVAANEIRLEDVPDMGYLTSEQPPRGEVCIRGLNVMMGYFKDPEKTAEALDKDGWLHTGDIGLITPQGTLAIIDRKKNLFKLAQGEYIAPEKLEAIFSKADAVMQCYVHGDSLQSQLIGVLVLDPEKAFSWLRRRGVAAELLEKGMKAVCEDATVNKLIVEDLSRIGKHYKLQGYMAPLTRCLTKGPYCFVDRFEMIKAVHLEHEPWSVENDFLTPSFKLKRNMAAKKYADILKRMYEKLNASTPESKL